MRVSYECLLENLSDTSNQEMYHREIELALLVEDLGFDEIWCVEHHFDYPYSICPDNLQFLTYLAAKTEKITLVPAAIILPWHSQPLRTAERIALLDTLAKGRLRIGVGRGLSPIEYRTFGIDMNESRDRFDEAYAMISDALETGVIEGHGPFYQQPRAELHPGPTRSFKDRIFTIAMSPDSVESAAKQGLPMATFIYADLEVVHKPVVEAYKAAFEKHHGRPAPRPCFSDFVYCHEDPEVARERAYEYVGNYFVNFARHYELFGEGTFNDVRGYQSYQQMTDAMQAAGKQATGEAYINTQTWGTPEQIIEKFAARRDILGDHDLNLFMSFGGMSKDVAEASMKLFAAEVLPALRDW